MTAEHPDQECDLFSSPPDLELARHLLSDLHAALPEMVGRYRYLRDISATLGENGTLFFGGVVPVAALGEARSSFVQGNFMATILLCQALAENALGGVLHMGEDLPAKISFHETLSRCEAQGILTTKDVEIFKRLMNLRNPLSHFRDVSDPSNLLRRSMTGSENHEDLLRKDAHFAITTVIRLLSGKPFRVG